MRKNVFLNETPEAEGTELTAVNSPTPAPKLTAVNSPSPAPKARPLGGVVGAMRDTLGQMTTVPKGEAVVDIATDLIDDSFVPDRMEGSKLHHDALVAAIREQGQLVPVLLRPKAGEARRYQVAYGHRRVRALKELGKPVRAVVRELSDEELVIAQGQENNARRDLSFIEKATFAMALEQRGFDREKTIASALSVDKTELSRLLTIGRSLPPSIVAAIGPAPKAGRGRWSDLAARLEAPKGGEKARRFIADNFSGIADSDERFARLFADLISTAPAATRKARVWTDPRGRKLARIERGQGRFVLSIDEKLEPAFGEFIEAQLSEIYRAFEARTDASTAFLKHKEEG